MGLAALLTLSLSRAASRTDDYVPLDEQDTSRWDAALVAEGESLLRRASGFERIGRFQLEAAIQSVHCDRARSGVTDWDALRRLYTGLMQVAPTLGARVALAATIARTGDAAGLAALDLIEDPAIERFQPAWALRGELTGDHDIPERAIALSSDPRTRRWLKKRRVPD